MNNKGKALAITGVILQAGILIGVIGTVVGMLLAFHEIGQPGEPEPELLANYISVALFAKAGGMLLCGAGAIALFIALCGLKYRAPWFRIAMWIISILWLFGIPIGTMLGIMAIIYLINHRDEFTEPTGGAYRGPASPPANDHL